MIESQLTWQRFIIVDDVLTIAVKRKQIGMIKLLLSYCDNIEQTNIIKDKIRTSLSTWLPYEVEKNGQGRENIIIPLEYTDYAQYLVDVFIKESFPNDKLSHNTEVTLISLHDNLLCENAMKLDDYLDAELLLLAVQKAYRNNFTSFNNRKNLDVFCIRVMGFIQSVLAPETAKIICEGFNEVVIAKRDGVKKKINECSHGHQLKDGQSYYRSSRDSLDGLGVLFFAGIYGEALPSVVVDNVWRWAPGNCDYLEHLCREKAISFQNLTTEVNITTKPEL